MQCDFRELAARSRNNAVAFIVIVLLLFPSSPSVLCVSPGNHVAFEDINALCYMSSGISDLSGRQPDTGFNGSGSCKNCTDFLGEPWAAETKRRVLEYIQKPTNDLWEDIHGIIINRRGRTIWQAVCVLDPTFPKIGRSYDLTGNLVRDYQKIPNPITVIKAIDVDLEAQGEQFARMVPADSHAS